MWGVRFRGFDLAVFLRASSRAGSLLQGIGVAPQIQCRSEPARDGGRSGAAITGQISAPW